MVNLTIYGQPNRDFEYLKIMLHQITLNSEVDLDMNEVTDWETMIAEGILGIPTIRVNGNFQLIRKNGESIDHFIKKASQIILKSENYGNMIKIIVPIDFSENAKKALLYGIMLAEKLRGVVEVVHVYHPKLSKEKNDEIATRQQLDSFLKNEQNNWLQGSLSAPLLEKSFRVGFPVQELAKLSRQENTMLVMGTTGAGDKFKARFGSVSTALAQQAACPLLLIPPNVKEFSLQHMAYATDNDLHGEKTADILRPLAEKLHTRVSLVHVNHGKGGRNAYELLEHWSAASPSTEIKLHKTNHPNITGGLQEFCLENDVDLLAMTAVQRGFFKNFFHHSITDENARHTRVPLLIIPQNQKPYASFH